MTANADQLAYWNGPTGDKWAKYQGEMDRSLAEAADALMAFAKPGPGEKVLDVGCGAGATSLLLAEKVGSAGSVTGLDISQPMLAAARARVPNVRFIQADAAGHAFAPEHDLIASRFGVMFFDDPAGAFGNLRRAMKPGGRLAFVSWRSPKENDWVSTPFAAARPFIPPQPVFDPTGPGQFSLADTDHTRQILEQAGWRDIRLEKFDGKMYLGANLDDATFHLTRLIGPTSRVMKEADDATRTKITEAVRTAIAPFETPQGVMAGIACWLVGAKA